MWLKLFLLSLYLLLLFFLSRILEAATWYHGTNSLLSSYTMLDPFSLSVKKLKQLLDNRGIDYSGVVEKQELISLVEASGRPGEEELSETSKSIHQSSLDTDHQTTHFTCGSHFYEEVEDTKDSIWLVQVVTGDSDHALFDDFSWSQIILRISSFGVRTGIFRCSLDASLCSRKGWNSPRLIMALPRSDKAKEDVIVHSYLYPAKVPAVLQWVRQQLSSRVQIITSNEVLQANWINFSPKDCNIKVVLFSTLKEPPLFFSSLAIKFTGRVKFGMFPVVSSEMSRYTFFEDFKHPAYLVITPEKTFEYGLRPGECFNFKCLGLFLKSFRPEINDIFLLSLFFINALASFELFLICGQFWKHFIRYLICIVKYNCTLFLAWLLIVALYQFSFMTFITEICLKFLRIVSETNFAALFRNDWNSHYSYLFLLATFIVYGIFCCWLLNFMNVMPREEELPLFSNWWFVSWDSYILTYFFRPMATLTRPVALQDLDLEEGMELLIERLAVPNLWLQPVIPMEYIKDLPVWKYQGWCEADDIGNEKFDCLSSSEDESIFIPQSKSSPVDESNQELPVCEQVKSLQDKYYCQSEKYLRCSSKLSKSVNSLASQKYKNCTVIGSTVHQCISNTLADMHMSASECSQSSCYCDFADNTERALSNLERDSDVRNCDYTIPKIQRERAPIGMLEFRECSICLENYGFGEILCGLPCGHNYHMNCIMSWLYRDNHCCPICRWPSYKVKHRSAHQHYQ